MAKFKRKIKLKSILCGILVVATLIGVCAGLGAIFGKETKNIGSGSFERGSLSTETGNYVEDNTAIFTSNMFECMGLVIESDVKFTDRYQVFYYNFDGVYLSASAVFTETARLDIPELAKYARVVIYTDEEIGYFGVLNVAKKLDIKVSKDQNFTLYNHFEMIEGSENKIVSYGNSSNTISYQNYLTYFGEDNENNVLATGWSPCKTVNVTGWKNLVMIFEDSADSKDLIYFFTQNTANGEQIVPAGSVQKRLNGGLTQVVVEVPQGANNFYTNTLTDAEHHYVINQYN